MRNGSHNRLHKTRRVMFTQVRANGRGINLRDTWLCPDDKPWIPAVIMHLDHPLRGGATMTADEAEKFGIALIQVAHDARNQAKKPIKTAA